MLLSWHNTATQIFLNLEHVCCDDANNVHYTLNTSTVDFKPIIDSEELKNHFHLAVNKLTKFGCKQTYKIWL